MFGNRFTVKIVSEDDHLVAEVGLQSIEIKKPGTRPGFAFTNGSGGVISAVPTVPTRVRLK